ncbi:MAG: alpha/beta hydrolase [Candidatus Poribacteria bacterium]|nr:alpha/beta hydrolase [Candidatus Poribacteria bacterium]
MKKPMMQMIVVFVLMLFLVAATLVLGQRRRAAESMKAPEGVTVYRDIAYVADGHERQKLDLYIPDEGENLPLIIWIHGGAWLGGDKAHYNPRGYLKSGYAGASINYRLSQHAIFPAQIKDVKAAVRWLRANADTYRLDPNRFAAWGSSAGGHLVAMLGTTGDVNEFEVGENLEVSSRVQAIVDYYGPTDFLQMDTHRLPDGLVHDAPDSPESKLVGGPIQEHKDRVAKANPITYVSDDDSPFLIIHGDQDKLVPYQQSVLLKDALEKAGVPVTFYKVEGGGHGWFRDPKVPELTKAFLEKHLKP